jgi:glycosyltransferase involved in cell wall biosynthesis
VLDRRWADQVPDVVHLHSWQSGLAVRDPAAPLAQSFHGLHGTGCASNLVPLERLTALAADRIIASSSEEVSGLVRIGVPRARVSLVPWGVDTEVFSPDGPAAPRGGPHRVLALGEVAPHSGFRTAIEALRAVPGAELLIVGHIRSAVVRDDPEVGDLLRHADELGVKDRVRFTGQVKRADLPPLLRSADVAVCVPRYDPAGITALRAMACGAPVIASTVDALADVVIDGLTGVKVPPCDSAALGQALRDLLADPVRREICKITSVDRVRTRYSWDRVAAEVVDAYSKALRQSRDKTVSTRA